MLFIIFVLQNESLRNIKCIYKFLILILLLVSCKSTKFVPKDRYLLKKNTVKVIDSSVEKDEFFLIIKQQPNTKLLLIPIRINLYAYNHVDSLEVAQKRTKKNLEIRQENASRKQKEDSINFKRIKKARDKNEKFYKHKIKELKDTLNPNLFFKEWLKYKVGEEPVVFDSLIFNKSIEQIGTYLRKKGYYKNTVIGSVKYKKRSRKAKVSYLITPGECKIIDSVYVISTNDNISYYYTEFIKKEENSLINQPFNITLLDNYRYTFSRFVRDNGMYDFNASSIVYNIDTIKKINKVTVGIEFKERMVIPEYNRDTLIARRFEILTVNNVYFHILDTTFFKGSFKDSLKKMGLQFNDKDFDIIDKSLPTIDTLVYHKIIDKHTGELAINRKAYFYYNGDLFVNPELLEAQSLLEKESKWSEESEENTYSRLQQLGVFQTIKIEKVENVQTNRMDIHYYLIPNKKESFSFEPRVSSSNGFLGLTAGMNYKNKNFIKGVERLTFAINGGFQAQPAIFDQTQNTKEIVGVSNNFYQFEIGPSLKLELPGLFPFGKVKLNKSRISNTVVSTAYSFQKRDVFSKKIFQMNYAWKYTIGKNQIVQMGLPGISVIKFVSIKKIDAFQTKIDDLNDIFLQNTYSDQFVWQDWKFTFEYRNNSKIRKKSKSSFYYTSSFDLGGNLLSLFKKYQSKDLVGQYAGQNRVFGLVYSQFVRADNEVIYSYPIGKAKSINFRALGGLGLTYGNSNTSMPYDYSFYAGGSNDVRGWKARALGPGSYKYYLDTNRTALQVADIRISGSAEYRFQFNNFIKGAFFVDGGNVWTMREDGKRPGSQISADWFREIALAAGVGIRMDFDFFILRFDIGVPVRNPALPIGERWAFQKQNAYHKEIDDFLIANPTMTASKLDYNPFFPHVSFGIGYPF